MFAALKRFFRRTPAQATPRAVPLRRRPRAESYETTAEILASWDAAQTTTDNSKHWANADTLSAAAAASPAVRSALRSRARYEAGENNCYAKGMVRTLANHTIGGKGPRLQMLLPDAEANARIEKSFARWSKRVKLAKKLRTMRKARAIDGEAFALYITNRALRHPVQLDLRLIEADQVTTPFLDPRDKQQVDGIRFDADGNPTAYHVLDQHPGDTHAYGVSGRWVPADEVIHWFPEDRAGQKRGLSEIGPALPLFAQLRRFTLATIAAGETAADFAAVMYTDGPAVEAEDVGSLDAIPLDQRVMTTLPAGWKLGQIKSEHPSTTYPMFKAEVIGEAARCIDMPYNVAAGNSSDYNYASGRLDHQTFFLSIDVDHSEIEDDILDPTLEKWWDEAALIPGLLPEDLGPLDEIPHRWVWPGHKHVDPLKEANASTKLWDKGLLSDDEYLYAEGVDPDEHHQSMALMIARRKALGLPLPGSSPAGGNASQTAPGGNDDADDAEDDTDDNDTGDNASRARRDKAAPARRAPEEVAHA